MWRRRLQFVGLDRLQRLPGSVERLPGSVERLPDRSSGCLDRLKARTAGYVQRGLTGTFMLGTGGATRWQ